MTRDNLPSRRSVLASIAAAGAFAATARSEDSKWPDHPVRIIVPYPAGGSTDVLSRILAERMKDIFGQPFVIDVNPNCDLSAGADLAQAAGFAKWTHADLVDRICRAALRRRGPYAPKDPR